MHAVGAVLLLPHLCILSNAYTLSERSWWLSDTELVYEVDAFAAENNDVMFNNTTKLHPITSSSSITHSRDLKYRAEYKKMHDTDLYPDRTEFSMVIHDDSENMQYHVGPSAGYEVSRGRETIPPSRRPMFLILEFTNDVKPHVGHKSHHARPYGENLDVDEEASEIKGGLLWFSQSDKYLAHAVNSANKNKTATPVWTVSIWSVEEEKSIELDFPLIDNASVNDLDSASWVVLHGQELLVVTWSNRWDNETAITLCTYENATCTLLYEHKYNMVHSDSALFFILPEARSDNAWQHIAKMEISPDFQLESISFLPSGEYDVRKILAYRSIDDVVVFESQAPHPWNRHVYATQAGELSVLLEDRCLSCVSANCTFQNNFAVSKGDNLKIGLTCFGPRLYYTTVISYNATLHPEEIHMITKPFPWGLRQWNTETYTLSNGYEAIARIYQGNADLSSVAVTLMVYGGPEWNQVEDSFLNSVLPIGNEHAIVCIDVRGSGGRGWNYRSGTYGRFLSVEVEDTIEAMEMVLEKYPRLDRKRVGVYGWSYGGSMTTALVERAPQSFFKCAVVGAPVTNFAYYYNPEYMNRYMGDAPPSAYVDLTRNVTAFKHTKLLLVHGLRDGNVLFHHSALLIEALQEANIHFELMVYPNQEHYFYDGSCLHWNDLFKTFLSTCYEAE